MFEKFIPNPPNYRNNILLPDQPGQGKEQAEKEKNNPFITFVKKLNKVQKALDKAMRDFMMLQLSADYREQSPYPHETHMWHGQSLTDEQVKLLDQNLCAEAPIDKSASVVPVKPGFSNPSNHVRMPSQDNEWKTLVMLHVENPTAANWHVGWIAYDDKGEKRMLQQVSRLPLEGNETYVRAMAGPHRVTFFALDSTTGRQLPLRLVEISSADKSSLKSGVLVRRV